VKQQEYPQAQVEELEELLPQEEYILVVERWEVVIWVVERGMD
jgi:hypothetical protein